MMADMSKACAPYDLSGQMVGFLSVLAISGSVALLSFLAKPKLLSLGGRPDPWTSTCSQEALHSQDEDFEEEVEKLHRDSHSDSSCEENEPSRPSTLKRKKKVRFALDVVEPPSNGQQYRSKWRDSHGWEKNAHFDLEESPCNDQVLAMHPTPPLSHHQHYKSRRRVSRQCEMHADLATNDPPRVYADKNERRLKATRKLSQSSSYVQTPSNSCQASQGCEMNSCLSHPPLPSKSSSSIPPNQLALYKGLRQSQLQYSLRRRL